MKLKEIVYRGGLVSFRIPADWVEEYQPEGGGTFYRDAPDSGTLRLNVLTFERKQGREMAFDQDPLAHLASMKPRTPAPMVERISVSVALRKYRQTTEEEGVGLAMWHWEVCQVVTATVKRLFIFTYSITVADETEPRNVEERELLDRVIREARYADALGI